MLRSSTKLKFFSQKAPTGLSSEGTNNFILLFLKPVRVGNQQ